MVEGDQWCHAGIDGGDSGDELPKCAGGISLLEGRDVPGLPLGRRVFLAEDSPGVDCR